MPELPANDAEKPELSASHAEAVLKLVAASGRASAEAERAVKANTRANAKLIDALGKRVDERADVLERRVGELEARIAAMERNRSSWTVVVLEQVKGLSVPAQVAVCGSLLFLSLAVAGYVFPNIVGAIAAIGDVVHVPSP